MTSSTREPQARRYPCPFCQKAEMWPDLCSEDRDAGCKKRIERSCMKGDHRRCALNACTVAARWHEPVQEAGVEAARAAGAVWAVVSTIGNDVTVVGTENNLGRAKSALRNKALWRAGITADSPDAGQVYIVRGSDGGFV